MNKSIKNLLYLLFISTVFSFHLEAGHLSLVMGELDRLRSDLMDVPTSNFPTMPGKESLTSYNIAKQVIGLFSSLIKNKDKLINAFKTQSKNTAADLEADITREATGEHVMCYEYDDVNLLEQTIVNAKLVLIAAYEKAKEGGDNKLIEFFKAAFTAQGCLNARIEFMQKWLDSQGNFERPSDYCKTILGTHYTNFALSGGEDMDKAREYLISKGVIGAKCLDDDTKTPRNITEDDLNHFISEMRAFNL